MAPPAIKLITKNPRYRIRQDTSLQWRWTYYAANGEAIAVSSESYKNRADCERGIQIMKESANSPVTTD